MDGLIMAGQLLLGLSILVILHELGHFLAARAFGIKVEKFYLFFDAWGVKLVSFKYKDCEYGIGWLPLGGYVKITGMIDESMDTEQLAGPPQPWEFRSKPAWQRLIVMLAGVFVNIVLGIFIFWMLTFKYGESYTPNDKLVNGVAPGVIGKNIGLQNGDRITAVNGKKIVRFEELISSKVLLGNSTITIDRKGETKILDIPGNVLEQVSDYGIAEFVEPRVVMGRINEVAASSGAQKAGLQKGDSILSVNGKPVHFFDEYFPVIQSNKGKAVSLSVLRNNQVVQLNPQVSAEGTIGVVIPKLEYPVEHAKYSFIESLPVGASKAWGSFTDNAKGLGKVLTGQVKANKAFTGPVGIAKMFGSEVDWIKFWSLVGLLSMALALMNLLPIPALDGGHAMFLLIEMIKGSPLSDKFMERAQIVGFCIIVALMVFVLGNDILKVFKH
ncbi:RIP metalloprotease RseP [Pedobacter sp. HMF7647]|uniref:Zinc metalloprotease n=1 Tax=Hufsiella arboris TaxID=2695275 RepID=A0A7K1YGE4_9SPHI|nr:RIP metalloprotease RseP [Hufsiella arboris]MXV53278.1 RIP metalloprotease RseP [Hufsiella arboris]